ncbi:hypothetical protein VPHD518_0058 [Vibrio phage D518]
MTTTRIVTRIQRFQVVLWRHHNSHALYTFGAND